MNIESIKNKKNIKELLEFGILNIDKPSGPTSFQVDEFIKKSLELRKASHFGTLDPNVSGVLPIALNRACKLTGFFIGEDKEYIGIMRFHNKIDKNLLLEIINKKFLGKITQIPPVKSRVKRVEREREIKKFEIIEASENEKDFLFRVECQGGTYIRKLIDDLGKESGIGAHMLELRRTRAGIFFEDDRFYPSVKLYDFNKAVLEYKKGNESLLRKIIIPGEIIANIYQVILLKEDNIKNILTGKPIYKKDTLELIDIEKGKNICAFLNERFIGVYRVINEGEIFAKPEFVFN